MSNDFNQADRATDIAEIAESLAKLPDDVRDSVRSSIKGLIDGALLVKALRETA